MKPDLIIGITGISGAGKSTLTHALAKKLNASSLFWDDFDDISKSPEDYVAWYNNGEDYSEFDYQSLADAIKSLKTGHEITHPVTNHLLKPTKYIIVDAPLGKMHQQTAQFIDFFIHINVPLDIALARRIVRDVQNNHLQEKEIIDELNHYLTDSRPLFADEGMCTIANSADYTVDGQKATNELVMDIVNYLKNKSNQTREDDISVEIVDEIDKETDSVIHNEFIAYEAKNDITVNYKRFSLILKKNNVIVGAINAFTAFAEIYIDDMWVAEKYRNNGLGRMLLTELESRFKGKGFNNINLVTSAFQAPEFYKKCGFKEEFKRYNEVNSKLTKTFFVKYFGDKEQYQGILNR